MVTRHQWNDQSHLASPRASRACARTSEFTAAVDTCTMHQGLVGHNKGLPFLAMVLERTDNLGDQAKTKMPHLLIFLMRTNKSL